MSYVHQYSVLVRFSTLATAIGCIVESFLPLFPHSLPRFRYELFKRSGMSWFAQEYDAVRREAGRARVPLYAHPPRQRPLPYLHPLANRSDSVI